MSIKSFSLLRAAVFAIGALLFVPFVAICGLGLAAAISGIVAFGTPVIVSLSLAIALGVLVIGGAPVMGARSWRSVRSGGSLVLSARDRLSTPMSVIARA